MGEALGLERRLGPRDFLASAQAREREWPLSEAEAYTRWLATSHYENFHIASLLLPKRLHQDFFNIYAYCRWADDLGDEIGEKEESLRLLAWWGGELDRMYAGNAAHPVFVALKGTVEKHGIPKDPFANLIRAFVQDQHISRYQNWGEVFEYCRYSANPVGRLILYLGGYSDAERQGMSDATCTGLQLANFWQDVAVDLEKDRVYIPLDVLSRNRYSLESLFARRFAPEFRSVMIECVGLAEAFFTQGLPLAGRVDRALALDIDLFSRGGMLILAKIREQGYDVLARRPHVSKMERAALLMRALVRLGLRGFGSVRAA